MVTADSRRRGLLPDRSTNIVLMPLLNICTAPTIMVAVMASRVEPRNGINTYSKLTTYYRLLNTNLF